MQRRDALRAAVGGLLGLLRLPAVLRPGLLRSSETLDLSGLLPAEPMSVATVHGATLTGSRFYGNTIIPTSYLPASYDPTAGRATAQADFFAPEEP